MFHSKDIDVSVIFDSVCVAKRQRWEKRQRTRAARVPHDRIKTNGRGPDAGSAVPPLVEAAAAAPPLLVAVGRLPADCCCYHCRCCCRSHGQR
eukprot:gene19202-biopygen22019